MEQQPDIFTSLDKEINWEAQFIEAAAPLFATLQAGETGRELIEKTTNLLAMAEHQNAFAQLQLLAQLGDICCSNPTVAAAFQEASFFEEITRSHAACTDVHDREDDKKDKKRRRKRGLYR